MTQAEYACLTSPVWWLVARSWCDNAEDEGPGRAIPSMKRNEGPLPAILDSVIEIMVSQVTHRLASLAAWVRSCGIFSS